jgi:hypothetical protein
MARQGSMPSALQLHPQRAGQRCTQQRQSFLDALHTPSATLCFRAPHCFTHHTAPLVPPLAPSLPQVFLHASLDAVPTHGPTIYLAHEFLDALPVHQFVRDPRRGWLEVGVPACARVQVLHLHVVGRAAQPLRRLYAVFVKCLHRFMKKHKCTLAHVPSGPTDAEAAAGAAATGHG